jgi:hypothetical protein
MKYDCSGSSAGSVHVVECDLTGFFNKVYTEIAFSKQIVVEYVTKEPLRKEC